MVERLFLAVPRGCLQFVIVVFPDHTHLLFLLSTLSSCEEIQGWTQRGRLRGALQAEDLNRAVQAVSGVRTPLLIGGGFGGAPPKIFLKSMSLRMHFRPFLSPFFHIL